MRDAAVVTLSTAHTASRTSSTAASRSLMRARTKSHGRRYRRSLIRRMPSHPCFTQDVSLGASTGLMQPMATSGMKRGSWVPSGFRTSKVRPKWATTPRAGYR